MMSSPFSKVDISVEHFKNGGLLVVVDDESRENEGDIVFAAAQSTAAKVNFCAKEARGLVCIAIGSSIATRLDLHPVPSNSKDTFSTAFHDSIDATSVFGISTGISAKERSITAAHIASEASRPDDFIKPGHLFPVVAKAGGVLVRPGHTEAGVDLCFLTDQPEAAVICEIMDEDGNMMRRDGLLAFAQKHQLPIITIQQLIDYRKNLQ
jgi:3,4-dihydroxy 2-butanone 4-phosphate synthase/GTP cyclohydrolase II